MNEDFAYRAKVLITQRRYQDAVRLCRRGLLTDPSREEGRLVLGMALLAMRRFEEVRAEMLALLRARPEDSVARRLLGQAFLEAGDVVRAGEELEAARRISPQDRRITELLGELAEARDGEVAAAPRRSAAARWAEPEELETTPGEIPEHPGPAPAPTPAPAPGPGAAVAPRAAGTPEDDQTVPDTGPPGLRLELAGLGGVVTQVLPPDDAERVRRASVLMTTGVGEAALPDSTLPETAAPTSAAAPKAVAVTPHDGDLVDADPATDVAGPPPMRPFASPAAQVTDPGAVSFPASAKGWPDEPPPTITPVMPALVRAAARLAAATRGKSSLRPAPETQDSTPTATPADAAPDETPTPAPPPLAVVLATPASAPVLAPASSLPVQSVLPPRPLDPLDIDTKSYAEASEEARARDAAVRAGDPRPRKASLEEVLAAQQKFTDAVSEISEVSEIDQSALPRPAVEVRAPSAARPPEAAKGGAAEATDEEPESTVTEVPQSYREGGGGPRASGPRAPLASTPAMPPAPASEVGRPSAPMTVVAKPVGNMATQHAASDGASPTVAARAAPAPPSRPQVPEVPRGMRPVSETVPAPSLPDDRVTRALDPDERVDRESSLPPQRLSQPPSFLEPPVETPRRPGGKSPADAPRLAGPPGRSALAPPAPASLPGLSSLPPPMSAPGRVTMPVIDGEDEGEPRVSKPTVDGTPKGLLTAELRDSDSVVSDAMDGRYDMAPKRGVPSPWEGAAARREAPRAAAPPPSAPAFKPPPARAAAPSAAFDPLDRPLSPEEFESSISRGPIGGGVAALPPSVEDSSILSPADLISGSEQVLLPEVSGPSVAMDRSGSPLDEPLSPDDFSGIAPPPARAPSISLQPSAGGDPLDEPLSPDDFSYDPERAAAIGAGGRGAAPAAERPRPPPAKPIVGPAPPMAIPRDALRQVPVMKSALQPALPPDPLDEPMSPGDFSQAAEPPRKAAPKRVAEAAPGKGGAPARAEAGAKPAPVRIVAKKGQAPVKVPTKPLPKQRPRTDSRLLRYAIPSAIVAVVLVLGVTGFMAWRAGRLRAAKVEAAEKNEALGDYPSLRTALVQYREISDEVPDGREHLARVARTYALLAFEFGLPDDEREARALLERLRAMGAADAASAPIEGAASAYLFAAQGRLDDAELTLRPYQATDPHIEYLRGRIALQREAFGEAARILRASTHLPPSWVRQQCALVEAMLGQDPQNAEWLQFLEVLGTTHPRHVGVRLLRARLLAAGPHTHENARLELQSLAQPALWNSAAPSEQAWVHLLNAYLAVEGRDGRQEATRSLRSARDIGPVRDVKFRLLLVRVLVGLRQLAEAKQELQGIVTDAPPRARSEARLLLAETHLDLGEIAEAEALLAQVDESARRHLLRGRVLMAQRKMNDALLEFGAAKTQDPSLAFVVDLESARAQLNIGQISAAVVTAETLFREHPNDVTCALLLGDAQLKAGNIPGAEAAYRNAARLSPDGVEARMKLANLAHWRGDLTGARAMLEEILTRDGGNIEAHAVRASLAGESGNLDEARQMLARIQQLPNAQVEAGTVAVLEAELSLRAGTLEGVEALLERAQRGGASEGDLQHVLGLWKLRTYKFPDALSALRRASESVPGDSVRRAELARAYLLSDPTPQNAEQAAEDALHVDAHLADALVVKALILMDKGRLDPAAALLEQANQALQARPRDANVQAFVLMARGRYQWEYGNFANAQRMLEEAIRLDGTLAEAHFHLGRTHGELGRNREACAELARYAELAPGVHQSDLDAERSRLSCR